MRYLVLVVLYVAMISWCVTDVANREEREPFGLHKALWVIFIVLVPYVGAIFWLVARFRTRRRYDGSAPVAPDDDPDYLRWLRDQQRRKGTE
ncbi:PLD nuclease N-terminal domain-containing protein [Demequina sp.]|uniref:PLD nuclease N-terminal domain-containing protein n=1 Tax=Demequina sp. TaxID=2050685 RepID=UPI003D0E7DB4